MATSRRMIIRSHSHSSASFASSTSLHRSIAISRLSSPTTMSQMRTCMCSPTTHPGSFRCSLHKNSNIQRHSPPYPSNRLNVRRSAMTNSLLRTGTVEGEMVKRALAALIRPSSHQQRRRCNFKLQPSRLSVMSKIYR
ncbi:uncharacterized protein LOC124924744 [Impatiens glandulifera]|uniref:uncharacterized protein LOC124924744 n=1 Tax=Impatiens glandulifera TaxID=253017 RepID=UPI001FB09772|nr:uncharacterized protein LOC124924744 [Impatiens glandulifera]